MSKCCWKNDMKQTWFRESCQKFSLCWKKKKNICKSNKMSYGCMKSKNHLSNESFCMFHVLLDTYFKLWNNWNLEEQGKFLDTIKHYQSKHLFYEESKDYINLCNFSWLLLVLANDWEISREKKEYNVCSKLKKYKNEINAVYIIKCSKLT